MIVLNSTYNKNVYHFYRAFNCQKLSQTWECAFNTAILNVINISCGWCKLHFRPLRIQVILCHFPEMMDARRQYFYFLYKFLGIIGTKRLEQSFWTMIWIYCYLLTLLVPKFFSSVLSLLDLIHCCKLSLYAISRKTSEPHLRKCQ